MVLQEVMKSVMEALDAVLNVRVNKDTLRMNSIHRTVSLLENSTKL